MMPKFYKLKKVNEKNQYTQISMKKQQLKTTELHQPISLLKDWENYLDEDNRLSAWTLVC